MIVFITASLSSNTYNKASWCEDWTFEGTQSILFSTLIFPWDFWLLSMITGRPVLSEVWVTLPKTETIKSHNSRARSPSNPNPASKEMVSDSVELWETDVCFLHIQLLEQMYDFQKCTMFLQKWISNLPDLPRSQNLETVSSPSGSSPALTVRLSRRSPGRTPFHPKWTLFCGVTCLWAHPLPATPFQCPRSRPATLGRGAAAPFLPLRWPDCTLSRLRAEEFERPVTQSIASPEPFSSTISTLDRTLVARQSLECVATLGRRSFPRWAAANLTWNLTVFTSLACYMGPALPRLEVFATPTGRYGKMLIHPSPAACATASHQGARTHAGSGPSRVRRRLLWTRIGDLHPPGHSHVWWIHEINRFRRLSQVLVHFVIDRASLFTDHRISGRPISASMSISEQFESMCVTILQQISFLLLLLWSGVIDARSRYFVELLSRLICQRTISLHTFLCVTLHIIRPWRNTKILRKW